MQVNTFWGRSPFHLRAVPIGGLVLSLASIAAKIVSSRRGAGGDFSSPSPLGFRSFKHCIATRGVPAARLMSAH
ncbi:hypothetical protein KCP70_20140 [Salmonella enterica subsp. enterica]|nr:hypothetical protein KCP70_20140 [Salmonella enterica subsp. enterica]